MIASDAVPVSFDRLGRVIFGHCSEYSSGEVGASWKEPENAVNLTGALVGRRATFHVFHTAARPPNQPARRICESGTSTPEVDLLATTSPIHAWYRRLRFLFWLRPDKTRKAVSSTDGCRCSDGSQMPFRDLVELCWKSFSLSSAPLESMSDLRKNN